MSQKEVDLADVIHFFVERWKRMLVVMLVVSSLVFCGVLVKKVIAQNALVSKSDVVSDTAGPNKPYKAMALIELAQVLSHAGNAKSIVAPNLLMAAYNNDQVELTVIEAAKGDTPSNSLWVAAEHKNSSNAESLVKDAAEAIVTDALGKEQAAKQNPNKAYSVIGTTRIAKYELIERESKGGIELTFDTKWLLKTLLLSFIVGLLASLTYVALSKIHLDYRTKYPS